MPIYHAPTRDTMFLLTDVLGIERYGNLPGFADARTRDMLEAITGEAAQAGRGGVLPAQSVGRRGGLHAPRGRLA